jgi:hypothetical protein
MRVCVNYVLRVLFFNETTQNGGSSGAHKSR